MGHTQWLDPEYSMELVEADIVRFGGAPSVFLSADYNVTEHVRRGELVPLG
ncbi:hypothetical protein D3C84_1263690 [compost metagenome]